MTIFFINNILKDCLKFYDIWQFIYTFKILVVINMLKRKFYFIIWYNIKIISQYSWKPYILITKQHIFSDKTVILKFNSTRDVSSLNYKPYEWEHMAKYKNKYNFRMLNLKQNISDSYSSIFSIFSLMGIKVILGFIISF